MLPILAKDLAVTLRHRRSFVAAGIMFCVLIAAVCWSFAEAGQTPDRISFARSTFATAYYVQLLTLVIYVSGQARRSVHEEKSEARMDLLFVTPRRPSLMLLEKILAPVLIGCLFVFGSLPFYAIQFLMGGIGGTELTFRVFQLGTWMITAACVGAYAVLATRGEMSAIITNWVSLGVIALFATILSGLLGEESKVVLLLWNIVVATFLFVGALGSWSSNQERHSERMVAESIGIRQNRPRDQFPPFETGWRAVYQLDQNLGFGTGRTEQRALLVTLLLSLMLFGVPFLLNQVGSLISCAFLLCLTSVVLLLLVAPRAHSSARRLRGGVAATPLLVSPLDPMHLIAATLLSNIQAAVFHYGFCLIFIFLLTVLGNLFNSEAEEIITAVSAVCLLSICMAAFVVLIIFTFLISYWTPLYGPALTIPLASLPFAILLPEEYAEYKDVQLLLSSLITIGLATLWFGMWSIKKCPPINRTANSVPLFVGSLLLLISIVGFVIGPIHTTQPVLAWQDLWLSLHLITILAGSIGLLYWILESGE